MGNLGTKWLHRLCQHRGATASRRVSQPPPLLDHLPTDASLHSTRHLHDPSISSSSLPHRHRLYIHSHASPSLTPFLTLFGGKPCLGVRQVDTASETPLALPTRSPSEESACHPHRSSIALPQTIRPMSRRREEAELQRVLQLSTQQTRALGALPPYSLSSAPSDDSRDMELRPVYRE